MRNIYAILLLWFVPIYCYAVSNEGVYLCTPDKSVGFKFDLDKEAYIPTSFKVYKSKIESIDLTNSSFIIKKNKEGGWVSNWQSPTYFIKNRCKFEIQDEGTGFDNPMVTCDRLSERIEMSLNSLRYIRTDTGGYPLPNIRIDPPEKRQLLPPSVYMVIGTCKRQK